MKSTLQKILETLARAVINKYKPMVIGITGSVGKTSTKESIFTVLHKKFDIRKAEKNYNTEVGLPLTILGIPHSGKNAFKWIGGLIGVLGQLLLKKPYPKILILEYGIDHPGDMDYLVSIARPDIAVVTQLGDIPVHVEFFKDPEEVQREKAKLVKAVPVNGHVILNHDDYAVYDMKEDAKAPVLTFGFEGDAEIRIVHFEYRILKTPKGDTPDGISFKIQHQGNVVPFRISGALGQAQAYAAAAAGAVGTLLGMNMIEISQALQVYAPPPGRLTLIKGLRGSLILDDTYNAAPQAMRAALDTLRSLPARRRIAVLGDMLEIGKYAEQAHRSIGDLADEFVDFLFTVGPAAKFIADQAKAPGVNKEARVLSASEIQTFDNSLEVGAALKNIIREGDLILVKGSQSMRMEKVVEEIMAQPERASELLVRQDEYWKKQKV